MLKTEAIKQFLNSAGNRHLTSLYNPDMEVQVNVAQDSGVRVKGTYMGRRWAGWKNENTGEMWKSFRIPWGAKQNPEYVDNELKFNLAEHAEGIGMTGWNWKARESFWVGFDFDSIVNHEAGLDVEELEKIERLVFGIPWVTLIKSTSGKGLHIYVHLETPIDTANHTEHAAVARSVLTLLSVEAGYNFFSSVDACGGILWCYHRKQEGTNGLALIKEGCKLPISLVPKNWKDHIDVTSGKSRTIKTHSPNEEEFNELISSVKKTGIDEEHKRLLKWFKDESSLDWWWDSDHNMLVCHTLDLKEAHVGLKLIGIFFTSSTGSSLQNAYAFPIPKGGWVIRRHSLRVKEHPSWVIDPSGWTRCVLNVVPEFPVAARAYSGLENAKGEYVYQNISDAERSLKSMGIDLDLPEAVQNRTMCIKEKPDGKLIVNFPRESHDAPIVGWLTNTKGDRWEKVIGRVKQKREVHSPDYLVRHVVANKSEAGWYIFTRSQWVLQGRSNVATVLLSQQDVGNRADSDLVMSKAILNPWEMTNLPFIEEYPGNRQWNRDAAALSCSPVEGVCDTWLKVLEHCGTYLNQAVLDNDWCVRNAIGTGSDYLMCWVASIFQRPTEPLPYLFFVGPQLGGKSTLHEAIYLLFKAGKGYARADHALVNQQGFNAEIAGAVLCIVEETDLKVNKEASNRIKDWVTGKTISIHPKNKTPYDIQNTSHWIQCANDPGFCPIFPGDTRIVVIQVDVPKKDLQKRQLFQQLDQEKSAFLNLILNIELPEPEGRLSIPCISSIEKKELESYNKNDLELYLDDVVKVCYGEVIFFDEFYELFLGWLPMDRKGYWTKKRVGMMFPKSKPYVKGPMGGENKLCLGNITYDKKKEGRDEEVYLNTHNNRLDWRNRNVNS